MIVMGTMCTVSGALMGAAIAVLCLSSRTRPKSQQMFRKREKRCSGVKTMDVILIIMGVFLLLFTVCMIIFFCLYGAIPDTLVTCVFATLAGECGIMGWIKTSKERYRERKWELEDRKDFFANQEDVNKEE